MSEKLSLKAIDEAINIAIKIVKNNLNYFNEDFPSSITKKNIYDKQKNVDWTNGFWTGILWLCFEVSNDSIFRKLANINVDSFLYRIEKKIEVNHHDMGFLYSLSCVAAYKILKNKKGKEASLQAAEHLIQRYHKVGNFIQAWGDKNNLEDFRLIIDSLLNLPLIFWASKETKNNDYFIKATNHFETCIDTVIRSDGTTFHTYFFDPNTGKALYGKTKQGFSDDSCWARGQAWGIYGIALGVKYNDTFKKYENTFDKLLDVYLSRLPKDKVPYWDLIFSEGNEQSRDSSAGAIVVCGLLEMAEHSKFEKREKYIKLAKELSLPLIKIYSNKNIYNGSPLLLHGVYSYHSKRGNKGWDEGNIWGDYFYLEMLVRLRNLNNRVWNTYW